MFKKIWNQITVEPVMFLFGVVHGLYGLIVTSLYIDKVCRANFNFSDEICDDITNHKEEQIEVQKYTSVLQGYNGALQGKEFFLYKSVLIC